MKKRLQQSLEWPVKHAAAFKRLGLQAPRGVLLYGPPGVLAPMAKRDKYCFIAFPVVSSCLGTVLLPTEMQTCMMYSKLYNMCRRMQQDQPGSCSSRREQHALAGAIGC